MDGKTPQSTVSWKMLPFIWPWNTRCLRSVASKRLHKCFTTYTKLIRFSALEFLNQINTGQADGTPGLDLNVAEAWELGYTGKGVTIGIMDDGEYFKGCTSPGSKCVFAHLWNTKDSLFWRCKLEAEWPDAGRGRLYCVDILTFLHISGPQARGCPSQIFIELISLKIFK